MTTVDADANLIFADARFLRDAAIACMVAGDVRDAAEKAWGATMRATEALVLARTGQEPGTSTDAGRRLRALSMQDQSLWGLRLRYFDRQETLHGECFYHNYFDQGEIDRLVQETSDYVGEAERLAHP